MIVSLHDKAAREFSRARAFARVDAARAAEHYARACLLEAARDRAVAFKRRQSSSTGA